MREEGEEEEPTVKKAKLWERLRERVRMPVIVSVSGEGEGLSLHSLRMNEGVLKEEEEEEE